MYIVVMGGIESIKIDESKWINLYKDIDKLHPKYKILKQLSLVR